MQSTEVSLRCLTHLTFRGTVGAGSAGRSSVTLGPVMLSGWLLFYKWNPGSHQFSATDRCSIVVYIDAINWVIW